MAKIRRYFKPLMICSACGLLALSAGGWLVFQHVPSWYRPRWLSAQEMQRVQREFDASFDHITRKLAAGQRFELSFTDEQLNDVIAAQPRLWPAAREWLGPALSTPRLCFEQGAVQVGIRHHWGSIQSIFNARLTPRVNTNHLVVALEECRAGSLRVPITLLGKRWAASDAGAAWWDRTVGSLLGEPRRTDVRNRFYWPNGDIPFRLDGIEIDEHRLTMFIEPLS